MIDKCLQTTQTLMWVYKCQAARILFCIFAHLQDKEKIIPRAIFTTVSTSEQKKFNKV